MKPRPSQSPGESARPARTQNKPLELNLAEQEFHQVVEEFEKGLVHTSDRPEIESRILIFLNRANGPSTAGIAAEMGISPEAAAVHLGSLAEANRAWSQPSHGSDPAWHISSKGRHFLEERGLLGRPGP